MFLNAIAERNNRFKKISGLMDNQLYLLTGSFLLVLYFTQLNLNLRWVWLDNLQSGEVYQQITGFLLLAYVIMQGRLGFQRLSKPNVPFRSLLANHKIYGVFAPILFYVHSMDVGFAYQVVLTFVFLGNSLVGYSSPQAIKLRKKWYILSWTILHVSLAILTLVLMLFHIYIVFYYS